MTKPNPIEVRANQYAADRLRELRGDEPRVSFGPKVNCTEAMIFAFERGVTRLTIGKLTFMARKLGVPVATFIAPEDYDLGTENDDLNDEKELAEA